MSFNVSHNLESHYEHHIEYSEDYTFKINKTYEIKNALHNYFYFFAIARTNLGLNNILNVKLSEIKIYKDDVKIIVPFRIYNGYGDFSNSPYLNYLTPKNTQINSTNFNSKCSHAHAYNGCGGLALDDTPPKYPLKTFRIYDTYYSSVEQITSLILSPYYCLGSYDKLDLSIEGNFTETLTLQKLYVCIGILTSYKKLHWERKFMPAKSSSSSTSSSSTTTNTISDSYNRIFNKVANLSNVGNTAISFGGFAQSDAQNTIAGKLAGEANDYFPLDIKKIGFALAAIVVIVLVWRYIK